MVDFKGKGITAERREVSLSSLSFTSPGFPLFLGRHVTGTGTTADQSLQVGRKAVSSVSSPGPGVQRGVLFHIRGTLKTSWSGQGQKINIDRSGARAFRAIAFPGHPPSLACEVKKG